MKPFHLLGTNHTSFTVSDLDGAISLFRDLLGLELISSAPRDPKIIEHVTGVQGARVIIAYLRGAGHQVELIKYLSPPNRGKVEARPCDTGFAHLAFDVDDIDAAISAAKKHQTYPISPPAEIDQGPNKGAKVVYLRNPDGITIEFIQPAERHSIQ